MKMFIVKINPEAIIDIKDISYWYNEQKSGLGKRFLETIIRQINTLNKAPYAYVIRYNEIRCMVVKKFPYLVHYYINESSGTIEVLAVISTDRDPENWRKKQENNHSRG